MKNFILVALLSVFSFSFVACDSNDGPAEEIGESMDDAADDVKDSMDDAADGVQDAAEDACENVTNENC